MAIYKIELDRVFEVARGLGLDAPFDVVQNNRGQYIIDVLCKLSGQPLADPSTLSRDQRNPVRTLRVALRLSQGALATALKVSRRTIIRWEMHEAHPPPAARQRLTDLANAHGLTTLL